MKPIEDPPTLVELLAREHAARAALLEADAADTQVEVAHDSSSQIVVEDLARACAERRAALDHEATQGARRRR